MGIYVLSLLILQVSSVSADPSQEIFSFSFGGSTDNLLSAGCNSKVF